MSQLLKTAVDEFQALWEMHYCEELPDEQAAIKAHEVFQVLKMTLVEPQKPVPENAASKREAAEERLRRMRTVIVVDSQNQP